VTVGVSMKLALGLCTDAHSKFVHLTTRFLDSEICLFYTVLIRIELTIL